MSQVCYSFHRLGRNVATDLSWMGPAAMKGRDLCAAQRLRMGSAHPRTVGEGSQSC